LATFHVDEVDLQWLLGISGQRRMSLRVRVFPGAKACAANQNEGEGAVRKPSETCLGRE
jgi:hypothetical protein